MNLYVLHEYRRLLVQFIFSTCLKSFEMVESKNRLESQVILAHLLDENDDSYQFFVRLLYWGDFIGELYSTTHHRVKSIDSGSIRNLYLSPTWLD